MGKTFRAIRKAMFGLPGTRSAFAAYRSLMLRNPRFSWGARNDESIGNYYDDYFTANRRALLDQIKGQDLSSIFEFGCYSGPNLRLFRECLNPPPAHLYGVDINRHAIRFAKDHLPSCELAVANDRSLKFLDEWLPQVDLSLAYAVFYVIETDAVRKLLELLRRKSRLILIGCNTSNYFGDVERLMNEPTGYAYLHPWQRLFSELSLTVLSTVSVPNPDQSCQQTMLLSARQPTSVSHAPVQA